MSEHTPPGGSRIYLAARGSLAVAMMGRVLYAGVFLFGSLQVAPAVSAARELSRALTFSAESLTTVATRAANAETEARAARESGQRVERRLDAIEDTLRAGCRR